MEPLQLLFYFIIVIPSAIIHEYAHGAMANWLGDPTAKYAGRLTLNPKAHIDWWGTILMPIVLFVATSGRFLFAYAKPVPYNPYNLRNQRWGPALVGLAGPAANFLLAFCFAMVVRFFPTSSFAPFLAIIVFANLGLMLFNLMPFPPLDGSKILYALLPANSGLQQFLERYSFMLMLLVIFFLFDLIAPVINILFNLLTGLS